jgi:competence protein ComEA
MRRPVLMAAGLVAATVAIPGAVRLYMVSGPEADLTITGKPVEAQAAVPSNKPETVPAKPEETGPSPKEESKIVVHVAGAVKKSGVYRLPPGSRCDDAVKAAGGSTKDAYLDGINLAAKVEDGQQLYVPSKKERMAGGVAASSPSGVKSDGTPGRAAGPAKFSRPGEGTVNLNTASAEELQRLPGVGPATAERIVTHRKENGGFGQIEDLMDVPRIGDKTFERLRPFIRVK